jgi:two-component system response regulator FixJ
LAVAWGTLMETRRPSILVLDGEAIAGEALTQLLRGAGLACRTLASLEAVPEQLDPEQAGCLVACVGDARDGAALVRAVRARGLAAPVILVSRGADVAGAVAAMKAGAADVLELAAAEAGLAGAVDAAVVTARAALARSRDLGAYRRRLGTLTEREREILAEVAAGLSSKEIGLKLGISPRTVEVHRARLMLKMRLGGLPQLVRMVALDDLAA